MTKPIPQGPFIRGLNAAAQALAQPKGSIPRVSNLIYTSRGALLTVDGSSIINWFNGALQTSRGILECVALFQPINVARYLLAIGKAIDIPLGPVSGLAAADGGTGGTLAANTYHYAVTALDGAGGETTISNEVAITVAANHKVNLTWTSVPNAASYNVYRATGTTIISGSEVLLIGTGLPVAGTSFTDTGAFTQGVTLTNVASPNGISTLATSTSTIVNVTTTTPHGAYIGEFIAITGATPAFVNTSIGRVGTVLNSFTFTFLLNTVNPNSLGGGGTVLISPNPPLTDTTQQVALFKLPNLGTIPVSYNNSNIVQLFPADPRPILPTGPGGTGGGGGSGGGGGNPGGAPPTAAGGVAGNTSSLPQMLQFQNSEVIALGNGYPPQIFTDPSTVTPVASNFVPAFPGWSPTTQFTKNFIIVPCANLWTPSTPFAANNTVIPDTANGFYYVCIVAGTSGTTQPAFPVTIGATVVDSGVTWKNAGTNADFYQCVQPGLSGLVIPPFTQTIGNTTSDNSVVWKNGGPVAGAAPPPPGAAHIIEYAGSLWALNTWPVDHPNGLDGPSALRMSDVNNFNSWNPINQAFLDKDDGTSGQGMAAFTITAQGIPPQGSLVVFKDFAGYQIAGVFGAADFAIQRIKSDMGCIAPRSIQFVPGFGIMRLSHLGIAVFDGVEDRIISEEIRPYIFPTNDLSFADITPVDANFVYSSWGSQTANPPMYVLAVPIGNSGGQLTRIFAYDLVLRAWSVIDLPFAISTMTQIRAAGTNPITMFGDFSSGAIQRWQSGDTNWYSNGGSPVIPKWSFTTPEAFLPAADQRLYCRNFVIRGINTNSVSPISIIPAVGGNSLGTINKNLPSQGDFDIFIPIGATGLRFHAVVSGTGDVEIDATDFHVDEKPLKVPLVVA